MNSKPRMARTTIVAGVAALAAVSMLAVPAIHAQSGPRGGRGPGGRGPGAMGGMVRGLRHLDLSQSQREQVRAVMAGYRPQIEALAEQLRPARQALAEAVTAPMFDEGLIRERAAGVAAAEAEMTVLRGRIHSDVFQLLTPEQIQKAEGLKTERLRRRAERRSRIQERTGRP